MPESFEDFIYIYFHLFFFLGSDLFVIVYAMTDSVYSHTWKKDYVYDVRFGTIAEPIYEEDSEPYIHFGKDELECLSSHPLGFDREEMGLVNNYKKDK